MLSKPSVAEIIAKTSRTPAEWRILFDAWDKTVDCTLRAWTSENGLSYSQASRHFSAIEDEITKRRERKTRRAFANYGEDAAHAMGSLLQSEKEEMRLQAASNIGRTVAAFANDKSNVAVQVNLQQNFLLAPSATPAMAFLKALPDADTETDS